ncbi:MAG: hypothetical protein K2I06_11920 [Ruminococcus sp.]|nr:hypothetical protein [Ruminococcus sp.]
MDFTFNIDNDMQFNINQYDYMNFEINNLPEKEYIEKELTPCTVFFSADALRADLVSAVFRSEEEEET